MKKTILGITALLAAAVMLTGCSNDNKSGNADGMNNNQSNNSQTTTSQSQTTTESQTHNDSSHSETGDVDGDGFLEELGTDVNDMVDDVVTDAEGIVSDVLDVGDDNGNR